LGSLGGEFLDLDDRIWQNKLRARLRFVIDTGSTVCNARTHTMSLLAARETPAKKACALLCAFAWGVTVVGGQRRGVLTRAKEEPGGGDLA